jgi:mRNA interferase YafQ
LSARDNSNATISAKAKARTERHWQPTLSRSSLRFATDSPLERRHRDHALTGDWKDHRDCHVKPDLVLIYCKPDDETLQLVRMGSHAELGW